MLYQSIISIIVAVTSVFVAHYLSVRLHALNTLADKIMSKSMELLSEWDNIFLDKDTVSTQALNEYRRLLKIKSAELDALVDAFNNKRTFLRIPYRGKIEYKKFLITCANDSHLDDNISDKNSIKISKQKCDDVKVKIIIEMKIILRSLY